MSAKKNSNDKDNQANPYLGVDKDPELEKRVDELMSIEESAPKPAKKAVVSAPEEAPEEQKPAPKPITVTHYDESPEDEVVEVDAPTPEPVTITSAPLLPTDKLPDLESEPEHSEVALNKALEEPIEPSEEAEEAPEVTEPVIKPEMSIAEAQEIHDDLGLEDTDTNKVVDEIIASDADELLAAQDRAFTDTLEERKAKKPQKKKRRIPKPVKMAIAAVLLIGVAATAAVPTSRYFILNEAGVRVSASVTVLDETTGQPLKNVDFSINDHTVKTDGEGVAKLDQLKLGPSRMTIKKVAFADISQPVTLGWGSNPLGEFRIKGVGTKFSFVVTDYVSKKPVPGAEATSGPANARANDKGEIVLTIPQSQEAATSVEIAAGNYRVEKIDATKIGKDQVAVQLVSSKKHVFISKRAGKFDLYKIDVDGKNEEKVLAGTGRERGETTALTSHPTKNIAALVSTRDINSSNRADVGVLTLINLDTNKISEVTRSERIQLIDWVGSKLIYVKIADGEAADSQKRHRLISYDVESQSERELASTNYFNDVVVVNGSVYYTPAQYQVNGAVGLYKVNAEGNVRKTVYDKEVWNLYRTAYDKVSVSVGQEWFDLALANDTMSKASGPPPTLKTRIYLDSPNAGQSLWVDERDGKGVLVAFDKQAKTEKTVQTQAGLKNPMRWLDDDHIIYRVNTNQETADYIFSLSGGEPRKIKDVTDTAGIDRWYYY